MSLKITIRQNVSKGLGTCVCVFVFVSLVLFFKACWNVKCHFEQKIERRREIGGMTFVIAFFIFSMVCFLKCRIDIKMGCRVRPDEKNV